MTSCVHTLIPNHRCVNALSWSPDGELLLSSGDDCRLLVWKHDPSFSPSFYSTQKLDTRPNSLNLRCVTAIRTGHTDNVFSAQLLASGSPLVATCARDRQVRVFDLERAGGTSTKDIGYGAGEAGSEARLHLLRCHTRQVKRVVTEESPSIFLTVAGVSVLLLNEFL
jgi:WD40 repeat protein